MPIYEEKLICPLAVRFTQEHIRPQFRDGHEVEESFKQITAKPGTGGYDFILEAPFPAIEIIRWCQSDFEPAEADVYHWFTLDNRRLYCLQRMAASLWPKTCAAHVEVLYSAGSYNSIKRKDTSLTVGRDVAIKCSSHADHWDWRAAVHSGLETRLRRVMRGISEVELREAEDLVSKDDRKASIVELVDAPEAPSMLDLLQDCAEHRSAEALAKQGPADSASTDTGHSDAGSASSPRSWNEEVEEEEEEWVHREDGTNKSAGTLAALQEALTGTWTGQKGESYEVKKAGAWATWTCVRWDASGSRKSYTLWYDEASDCISWGVDWSYYASASEVVEQPSTLRWFDGRSSKQNRPRFVWHHSPQQSAPTSDKRLSTRSRRFRQNA